MGSALVGVSLLAGSAWGASFSFTSDGQWATGTMTSTHYGPPPAGAEGTVRLDPDITTPFNHIWVAASGRGTAIRIDTNVNPLSIGNGDSFLTPVEASLGTIKGEYYTAPAGMERNPSRTTVDKNGDVWVGNRNEAGVLAGIGSAGSVAKISATPGAGTTSSGIFGDGANGGAAGTFNALPWTNAGGANTAGGVSTAADTAMQLYVRTPGVNNVRALAVDKNNNVWIGGNNNFDTSSARPHQLFDGTTGAAIAGAGNSFNTSVGTANGNNGVGGGYGMVIDGNGVVWAATLDPAVLVRHDPATNDTRRFGGFNGHTYGLGVDTNGKIWVSNWDFASVQRVNAATGAIEATFFPGHGGLRGVAITPADNDVWVASSFSGGVVRFNNDGTVQKFIATGATTTGVAVDSNGKVWVTNYDSNTVSRIDPTLDGGNGAVDLTIDLGPGAQPYNYSDMTGTVLVGTTNPTGTWRRVIDGGVGNPDWDKIFWNQEAEGFEGGGTDIKIEVRGADTLGDLSIASYTEVLLSGDGLSLFDGLRFLEVRATLTGAGTGTAKLTPVLSDLTLTSIDDGGTRVPEPGTLALLGVSALSLALLRRRRIV